MKISYVTFGKALDIHAWSGLEYYIARSLEKESAEIDYIANLNTYRGIKLYLKSVYYRLNGQRLDLLREPEIVDQFTRQINNRLRPDTELIFSTGSVATALIDTNKPKVTYSDAPFAGLIGFYGGFSEMCAETVRKGNELEQRALDSAKLVLYSSDWAAQTAINHYKVDARKVKVVPFGANIDGRRSLQDIKALVSLRPKKECHLLFMGVDWVRKGGDLAIKVAEKLNKEGLKTRLHLVGINKLPLKNLPDFVINHGFISKSSQEGKERIDALYSKCHFLLLPTRAEAYGLVFCEANSFGLPCVATNVGGIPTIIKDHINGKKFSLSDQEDVYSNYILSVFNDYPAYEQLAYSSFNEFENRLNWNVSGKKIMKLMKEI